LLAQDSELNRAVALKRIQERQADNPESRRRFLREAEITGRLEHPGVVPVYGLAQDAAGRPCYAMRFIQGESLKDAIQKFHAAEKQGKDPGEQRLAFRQLLTSFVVVCKTMAYAHSRGVLHRDLKPANIMLGKYGETLVVDWGLAKAFDRDDEARALGEASLQPEIEGGGSDTQTGAALGTPLFMSPEQAAGDNGLVGPASDIYSLGVTLYNLLTNAVPYDIREPFQMRAPAILAEVVPPRQRKKDVPRALEAICLKAMTKDQQKRYGTGLDLAADLEHWLADEPVSFYRDPWPQRLGRWVRQHRGLAASSVAGVAVAAVSLAVVSLLMGRKNAELATASAELAVANTREHEAAELARQTIEDMTSEDALRFLETQKELRPEQRNFLERAVAYYRQAVRQEAPGEEGQAGQARAYFRMGKLQQWLGLFPEAEITSRSALEKYQYLAAEHAQDPAYRLDLAKSHRILGLQLVDLGKLPEAEQEYRAALAEGERLVSEHPRVPEYRLDLAISHNNLGTRLSVLGKQPEAEKEYRAALAEQEALASEHPGVPEYRQELAGTHINLGNLLFILGKRPEAEKEYRAAVTKGERLASEHPPAPMYRQYLARSLHNLGVLLAALGKRQEAEKEYRAALVEQERLVVEHPQATVYRTELARSHNSLGVLLKDLGKRPEAEKEYRAALIEQERLAAEHPQVPVYRFELAKSHNNMGILLKDLGKRPEAEKEYRTAMVEQERLAAEHPRVAAYRQDLAKSHNNLGNLLRDLGKWPEAEKEYRAALVERERLVSEHPKAPAYAMELALSCCNFGILLSERGQPAESLSWYAKGIAALEPALSKLGTDVKGREALRDSHRSRAEALAKLGRYTEAIHDWDRALALDDGSAGGEIRVGRAKTLARAGEVARASADAEELLKAGSLRGDALYDISCLFSLASAKAKEQAQAECYAGRAVTVLRQAVAKGFRDIEHIKKDSDLDPLRLRDDFQKVLRELEAKKIPPGK
jgi:serine/threonine-protein kinase